MNTRELNLQEKDKLILQQAYEIYGVNSLKALVEKIEVLTKELEEYNKPKEYNFTNYYQVEYEGKYYMVIKHYDSNLDVTVYEVYDGKDREITGKLRDTLISLAK